MRDISKHYNLTLDTKASKILRSKDLIFNYADDITLNITILEDNIAKDLTNCKIDLSIKNEKLEDTIIHRYEDGGITIVENIATIVCKNSYIDLIGVSTAQLIIRDTDQNISTQKFMYTTNSTLIGDEIINAGNKINTLEKLENAIAETSKSLEVINTNADKLATKVEESESLIARTVKFLTDKVNEKIEEVNKFASDLILTITNKVADFEKSINDRIDGINNIVNYHLIKAITLKPVKVDGYTTIGFESSNITQSAEDLVRCGYDFMISGSPSSTQIVQSATGHLVFYKEVVNSRAMVRTRLTAVIDQNVQGKQLSPNLYFMKDGILTDNLPAEETNFKIVIRANIHQNNLSTGECIISPLGRAIIN